MSNLKQEVEALLYDNAPSIKIAKVIKNDIADYYTQIKENFKQSGGKDFLVKHTRYIDNIIHLIYLACARDIFGIYMPPKNSIPVALVALGSYGREQLSLHSDIDIMIVYEDIEGFNVKLLVENILYILWDTGLKIGHRVHTTDELFAVSKTDITIKTALLESRFIEGSKFIWTATQNQLEAIRSYEVDSFINEKLKEREIRYKKYDITMEPNIKEGVGGFRDANLVFWIGKVLYNCESIKQIPQNIIPEEEYKTFRIALEFLFRVRSALHLVTKKKEDNFRLELIPEIATYLDYKDQKKEHMKLAQKVIGSLRTIHAYCDIWIHKMLQEPKGEIMPTKPLNIENILNLLMQEPQNIDYKVLEAILNCRKRTLASKSITEKVKKLLYLPNAFPIFKLLFDGMAIGNVFPPFQKITDLPQFDGYHRYPVDRHSVQCIYYLENIHEPFIEQLYKNLTNDERAILKLATLLHDTGKGRKTDHSEVGALLIKSFAKKLGFSDELVRIAETLVLYHTLMSKIAQREDLYNQKTILNFVSKLQDKKTIDMLYILTYADMNGVENSVYNSFTSELLSTLYTNSIQALENSDLVDETKKRTKREMALSKNIEFKTLDTISKKKVLGIPSNYLFIKYPSDAIMEIVKMGFETVGTYSYKIANDNYLTIEIIRKESINIGYLLGRLSHLEILNMDIFKIFDDMKYFKIVYQEQVSVDDIMIIKEIIAKSFDPNQKANIPRIEILENEVTFDCEHSQDYASMHLHTKDQKGLIAYILEFFDDLGIDVASAKILTIKNRANDMFLIEKNGNFCHNIELIKNKLTQRQAVCAE